VPIQSSRNRERQINGDSSFRSEWTFDDTSRRIRRGETTGVATTSLSKKKMRAATHQKKAAEKVPWAARPLWVVTLTALLLYRQNYFFATSIIPLPRSCSIEVSPGIG
jgi:hypothetical protein